MSGTGRLAVSVDELEVYKLAFRLQQEIFEYSKCFPKEERYSLTDQARRSSRSVGANIREAWAKLAYVAHFRSKLTDSLGEASETCHWVKTAVACNYLELEVAAALQQNYNLLGGMLNKMIQGAESWCHRRT